MLRCLELAAEVSGTAAVVLFRDFNGLQIYGSVFDPRSMGCGASAKVADCTANSTSAEATVPVSSWFFSARDIVQIFYTKQVSADFDSIVTKTEFRKSSNCREFAKSREIRETSDMELDSEQAVTDHESLMELIQNVEDAEEACCIAVAEVKAKEVKWQQRYTSMTILEPVLELDKSE
ncbi:unnamed protein product [Durusdinium trenchii]